MYKFKLVTVVDPKTVDFPISATEKDDNILLSSSISFYFPSIANT